MEHTPCSQVGSFTAALLVGVSASFPADLGDVERWKHVTESEWMKND